VNWLIFCFFGGKQLTVMIVFKLLLFIYCGERIELCKIQFLLNFLAVTFLWKNLPVLIYFQNELMQ
jgi:hypothetical protein